MSKAPMQPGPYTPIKTTTADALRAQLERLGIETAGKDADALVEAATAYCQRDADSYEKAVARNEIIKGPLEVVPSPAARRSDTVKSPMVISREDYEKLLGKAAERDAAVEQAELIDQKLIEEVGILGWGKVVDLAKENAESKAKLAELETELPVLRAENEELRGTLAAYEAVGKVKIAKLEDKMLVYRADWERMCDAELYLISHRLGKTHEANNFYACWLKAYEASQGDGQGETGIPVSVEPAEAPRHATNPPLTFEQARHKYEVWCQWPMGIEFGKVSQHTTAHESWSWQDLVSFESCIRWGGRVYAHDPRKEGV